MKQVIYLFLYFIFLSACAGDSTKNNLTPPSQSLQQTPLFFKELQLKVTAEWLQGPFKNVTKKSQLKVTLIQSDGTPYSLLPGDELEFYSTMPSMGHPMEDAGYFISSNIGEYLNSEIIFTMSGEWLSEITIYDANGIKKDQLSWLHTF